jgi:hypothetical protein
VIAGVRGEPTTIQLLIDAGRDTGVPSLPLYSLSSPIPVLVYNYTRAWKPRMHVEPYSHINQYTTSFPTFLFCIQY